MRPAGNALAINRSLPSYNSVQTPSGSPTGSSRRADDGYDWARALSTEERTRRMFDDFSRTGNVSNNLWQLGIDRDLFEQLRAQKMAQDNQATRAAQAALPRPNINPQVAINPVSSSPVSNVPSPIQTQGGSPFQGLRSKDVRPWQPRLPRYRR